MSGTRQLMDYIDFSIYLSVDSRTFNWRSNIIFWIKKRWTFPL